MRVYKYRCRPPIEGAKRVDEVLQLAHRYHNVLVEVELHRRAAVQQILFGLPADDRLRKLCLSFVNRRAHALAKALRAANGLSGSWGTYLLVEQAIDAAKQSGGKLHFRRWDRTGRVGVQTQTRAPTAAEAREIKLYRRAAVEQVLSEMSVDDPRQKSRLDFVNERADALVDAMRRHFTAEVAHACTDSRLRIQRVHDRPGITPGSRRSGNAAIVHLRVDSVGRTPVWAIWPVTLHRPLPQNSTIKWAWMQRSNVGPHTEWHLCLTVDGGATKNDAEPNRTGTVAVDLGWRMRPDGMRVGYWRDDAGRHDDFLLPEDVLEDVKLARDHGSTRDRLMLEFRDRLAMWFGTNAAIMPLWFAEAGRTMRQWDSANRLSALAWRWLRNRFAGDEAIFDTQTTCARHTARGQATLIDCILHVDCWRRKDRHLYECGTYLLRRALARRDEHYKRWSAILARNYGKVVIEKFNLTEVAGRRGLGETATDAEKVKADRSSSWRHVGAPSRFRLWLLNACRSRATTVEAVDAAWTTLDCASCGARTTWDPALAIDHMCSNCGDTWDQDDQACVNLLARASGTVTPDTSMPLAGGKSKRQQRFLSRKKAGTSAEAAETEGRSQEVVQVAEETLDSDRTVGSPAHWAGK